MTDIGLEDFDPFALGDVERVIATTESQREVWLANALGTEASLAFNESLLLALTGPLDIDALHEALSALVARHETLRATVAPDGLGLIVGAPRPLALSFVDLAGLAAQERDLAVQAACDRAVQTPFDLARGPLFRAELLRIAAHEHRLVLTAHHIVCDGWSWRVVVDDLGQCYREKLGAGPSPPPPPGESFSDYVKWELANAGLPEQTAHEQFWLSKFTGMSLPVLDLPTDRARPAVRSFASRRIDLPVDADVLGQLRAFAATQGTSLFSTLLAGFAALLSRLTDQADIVIGVPAAGQSASGLRRVVGHCVNLLPVRIDVDLIAPASDLIHSASSAMLDAIEHQSVTFGSLLKRLPFARDPSRLPLVSVMFNLDQSLSVEADTFPELAVEARGLPRHFENFELFVNVAQQTGGLLLECQYNAVLFEAATVERWLGAYTTLLRSMAADAGRAIGQLEWLPQGELDALRGLQPAPVALPSPLLMHAEVLAQCRRTPDAVALRDGPTVITYAALAAQSFALSQLLRERGVGRGDRIGLTVPRGADMIIALLAVLQADAAYVPLDPDYPAARLDYCAKDAQLALLLTASGLAHAPNAWCEDAATRVLVLERHASWRQARAMPPLAGPSQAQAEDPAYVIYTSGSTGTPKGVVVPHRAAANFLAAMRVEPGLGADDTLAAVTTLSFDIAVLELLLPLTVGAQVLIVAQAVAMDGMALADLLAAEQASVMQATPATWRLLLDTPWRGGNGFKALIGGESCPPALAADLLGRVGELWNMYGPTETTVWSTAWRVRDPQSGIRIGHPIANTTVWILQAGGAICPTGVPGEICIGGAGVALGYLDRPELSAERFIDDPWVPGQHLYRTGDRGRWRNDGTLEHMGRLDLQVKVRGHRIEPGEIEAACNGLAGVAQSVVMAREDHPGDMRLVAYLVLSDGATFDEAAARAQLRSLLPDYMLPQHVVMLARMPLLPNGKLDRQALPTPEAPHAGAALRRQVLPRDELEGAILAAMESILHLPQLSIEDDFFAMGGHSLLAARLATRLSRDLDLRIPLRAVFEAPTAGQLARAVQSLRQAAAPSRAPITAQPGRSEAPLTLMQERVRFVEAMQPGRVVYNTPSGHRLRGPMNTQAFEHAFNLVVARQPSLRTWIDRGKDGEGFVQRIEAELTVELPVQDLSALPATEREAELLSRMQAIVDTPIDLCIAPLFRVALYRLAPEEHALLFMPHHVIWDGWSFDLLYEELAAIYGALVDGRTPDLPALPVSYGDFSQWHHEWLAGTEAQAQLAFWHERLLNAPIPSEMHPDRPRRAGMSGDGGAEWIEIDKLLSERLRNVALEYGVTLNMLTLLAYAVMVADATAAENVAVGVPLRGRLMHDLEPVMGFFNNTLPVHVSLPRERSIGNALLEIKTALLEVFAHQDLPFEALANDAPIAQRLQRTGLYQVMFSFQDARERCRQWGPLRQEAIALSQKGATEDLGLWLMDLPQGLHGAFIYNAEHYDRATAQAFKARYAELLERLGANPHTTLAGWSAAQGSPSAAYLKRLSRADPRLPSDPHGLARADGWAKHADEQALLSIWADALGLEAAAIGAHHSLFDLGGNSLTAMFVVATVRQRLGVELPPSALFESPTIPELALTMRQPAERRSRVLLRPGARGLPVFLVHDADGATLLYRNLAYRLDGSHAVYGMQPLLDKYGTPMHTRIEDIAAHYAAEIRQVQPHGPYLLGGLCAGGVIAFEIALQLRRVGEPVAIVALIDAADVTLAESGTSVTVRRLKRLGKAMSDLANLPLRKRLVASVATLLRKAKAYVDYEVRDSRDTQLAYQRVKALRASRDARSPSPAANAASVRDIYNVAAREYRKREQLLAHVVLFRASHGGALRGDQPLIELVDDPSFGWQRHVKTPVECIDIAGGHSSMLQEPNVEDLARALQAQIDALVPPA